MVAGYRGFARIAGGFLFVSLMTLSGPLALADETARPEIIPNGMMCTDQMETEPDYDDLDPTEVSDALNSATAEDATLDGGVCNGGAPVAI